MLPVAPVRVDNWAECGDAERGIERGIKRKPSEKKEKKMQPLLVGFFFLSPISPPLFFLPSCSQPLVQQKRFTLASNSPSLSAASNSLHSSMPLSLSLSHPYSTSVFLTPPVTLCTPLIHQLALRADNGLFHIAKEKEGEKCSKRGSVRQRDRKLEKT